MGRAECIRGADLQVPPWRRVEVASRALGLLDLCEDVKAAFVVILADFCRTDAACRAVQQPDAEVPFDCPNMLAHHGGRNSKMARGGSKAAAFDHLRKYCHARDAIHGSPRDWSGSNWGGPMSLHAPDLIATRKDTCQKLQR